MFNRDHNFIIPQIFIHTVRSDSSMKNRILYPYLGFVFLLSVATIAFSKRYVYDSFQVFVAAALITLIFNPLSWAVYYVAGNRRAYFKRSEMLIVYETLVLFLSALGAGFTYGRLNLALFFMIGNLAVPISWAVIYFSIDQGRTSKVNPGMQRTAATAPPTTTSVLGQGKSFSIESRNSGAQNSYGDSPSYASAKTQASQVVQKQASANIPVRSQGYRVNQDFGSDITLVGYVGGGKTTFTALFVYACQFIKGIPNFRYVIESSSPLLRQGLQDLLSGEWPSLTLRSEFRTQTRIVLSRKNGFKNRKVNLTINDVSGEIWREIAEQSENPGPKLAQLIRENPSVRSLIKAEKYLVTINCSDFDHWTSEQLYILDLFRSIRAINGGRKMKKGIGVVFTKLDLLPAGLQDRDPEILMRDHLPFVYSYIDAHFDSRIFNYFKVGLRVDEMNKPDVKIEEGKKKLTILGGGKIGSFPEIVRWMLD